MITQEEKDKRPYCPDQDKRPDCPINKSKFSIQICYRLIHSIRQQLARA